MSHESKLLCLTAVLTLVIAACAGEPPAVDAPGEVTAPATTAPRTPPTPAAEEDLESVEPGSAALPFNDPLTDPASGLPQESSDDAESYYAAEGYVIQMYEPDSLFPAPYPYQFPADLSMLVDVRYGGTSVDTSLGLVFRFQDYDNYYAFLVDGAGFYSVFKLEAGEPIPLIDWTEMSGAGEPFSTRTLRVDADGSSITVYADGARLASVHDATFAHGTVGLIGSSFDAADAVAFTNLRVTAYAASAQAAVAQQPAQPEPIEYSANFVAAECPVEVPADAVLECGTLLVPENRSNPASPQIELAVAILRAEGPQFSPDAVIYLTGGPGGSALSDFESDPDAWLAYAFHRDRDIVFLDQRGTGYSVPSLNCPELEAVAPQSSGADEPDYGATVACHDRLLAAGVDLTAYNTVENAADVADLRTALGYEQVNLYGVSYGTRLALAVLRDRPHGIRSVVLDSPFPPNVNLPAEEATAAYAAFQKLFAACAAETACNRAYPDLESVLLEVVARLNDSPDLAQLEDFETGELYDQEIYGDDVVGQMYSVLFGGEFVHLLPRMIYEVSQGNYDTYSGLATVATEASRLPAPRFQGEAEDRSDSEGMYHSVICRDEYAFGNYSDAEAATMEVVPEVLLTGLFGTVGSLFDTCDLWGAGTAQASENAPVVSDVPTLILAGQYDPGTPPHWGQLTAQTLSNAYFFELPGLGHSVTSGVECPTRMMEQFIADPTRAPDSRCIDSMPIPPFSLPGDPLDF